MYLGYVSRQISSLNPGPTYCTCRPDTPRSRPHKLVYELIHVKPLFLAISLTLTAVSFLTVREYRPFSGIDFPLSLVYLSLTGQLRYTLAPAKILEEGRTYNLGG
jgi:hypothetical protein